MADNVRLLCHFDGSSGQTTFVDTSTYAHALQNLGGSTVVNTTHPKFGTGCGDFTGNVSAGLDTNNYLDFNLGSNPFTIEIWGYFTSPPTSSYVAGMLSQFGFGSNFGFFLGMVYQQLAFYWSTTGSDAPNISVNYTPPLNTWIHFCAERDATGMITLYVNGAAIGSQSAPGALFASTQTCMIGDDHNGGRAFLGYLDDARVTIGVAVYGGPFTPPTAAFPDPGAPPVTGSQYGKLGYGQGLYSRYTPVTQSFAGNLAPTVTFSAGLTVVSPTTFVGNLSPTVAFGGALVTTEVFVGNLAPVVALSGGLSSIQAAVGSLSPIVAFSADLTVTPAVELAGDLRPVVTFGPALLTTPQTIFGDLAPVVAFAADMSVTYAIAGDLAPQTALAGALGGDWLLEGDIALGVDFAAELTSGPLWEGSEACPLSDWVETAPCPPSMWTPTPPPNWELPGVTQGWGVGPYGMSVYQSSSSSPWLPPDPVETSPTWTPSAPPVSVDWQETEACDG